MNLFGVMEHKKGGKHMNETTKAIQETETILFDTLTKMANRKIKPGRGSVIIHDALSILEYLNHRKLYPTL